MAQLLMIAVLLAQLLAPKTGGIKPADGAPMCPAKGCNVAGG